MPTNKELERTGTVVEALPNIMFRVQIDGEQEPILTYLSGKMRLHRIRVLVGDRVSLELEPYGGKARIVKRL
ncbi:MAG: translation initiation factor translation initiation factor [Parcubacteria group bacterium]|nr:translation initiation factor translation initiation factor [Parcubacteria group bacterium]